MDTNKNVKNDSTESRSRTGTMRRIGRSIAAMTPNGNDARGASCDAILSEKQGPTSDTQPPETRGGMTTNRFTESPALSTQALTGSHIGTLTFDLNDPEVAERFRRAVNADNAYAALWDVAQDIFRKQRKYSDGERGVIAEEWEKQFYEILDEHHINLEADWS